MKASVRLDSLVFQLTPTRTRCDLVITANGKSEKIASGLLDPYLAHLKSAQEQIDKGGYSIILEPGHGRNVAWFTKETVQRFVQFVNTPQVLERVCTIESEIVQIEEAIAFQRNNDTAPPTQVQEKQLKPKESSGGCKPSPSTYDEKAIVLYKPDGLPPETDGANTEDRNSRLQLLKVLETRRSVLQREQGMAFARAVAAGFEVDHIAPLVSFAECFGASRMMDACSRFLALWKAKHESGLWLEMESEDPIPCDVDFASLQASGVLTHSGNGRHEESWSSCVLAPDNNGSPSVVTNPDGTPQEVHPNLHEQYPGQFPHPMYPPWPSYPQSGQMPVFPPYPLPIPYYQNYPGNGRCFQSPQPCADDPNLHATQRIRQRRHSMDSRDLNGESETHGADAEVRPESDGSGTEEDSQNRDLRKKGRRSAHKRSGVVVIRNLNYISPQKQEYLSSDSQSGSEDDANDGNTCTAARNTKSSRMSKRDAKQRSSVDLSRAYAKDDTVSKHGDDGGHWQAFQSLLLKDSDEDNNSARKDIFGMEGKVQGRRRLSTAADDPSIVGGRQYSSETQDGQSIPNDDIVGDMNRRMKPSNDAMLYLDSDISSPNCHIDIQSAEMRGRRKSGTTGEDPLIHGRNRPSNSSSSFADPLMGGDYATRNDQNGSSKWGMGGDAFIVPRRPSSLVQGRGDVRTAVDMDSETHLEDHNDSTKVQSNYEPHELQLVPSRGIENGVLDFDPALDEVQAAKVDTNKKTGNAKQGTKKGDKVQKTDKKAVITKRGKPTKLTPSEEARARAEKLRSFKADLQKLKKEKEEEQTKRLEALKKERQKRIAARSGGSSAPSKKPLPTKLSPTFHKGSKFSDSEPGSSSPLQRSTLKTISKLSSDSLKASRSSGARIIKSTSSLIEKKVENKGPISDSKASMARIRRLSEPKDSGVVASSTKTRSAETLSRRTFSNGAETKRSSLIVNLDKIKFSALPEPKAKTFKGQLVAGDAQKKTSTKGNIQKIVSSDSSNASTSVSQKDNFKSSSQNDYDDKNVVEKTVVILEQESSFPTSQDSKARMDVQSMKSNVYPSKVKDDDSMTACTRVLPCDVREAKTCVPHIRSSEESLANKSGADPPAEKLPKEVDAKTSKETYHAPYARVSSLEDPCMGVSEYAKAPTKSLDIAATAEPTTALVSDNGRQYKLDKIWETSEKPVDKGSPKGLKRFLKLGRKKQSSISGEIDLDTEHSAHGDNDQLSQAGSSSEGLTLKSLLTQDEAVSSKSTPQKSSRSFSLLSPFRSKNSEKKPIA